MDTLRILDPDSFRLPADAASPVCKPSPVGQVYKFRPEIVQVRRKFLNSLYIPPLAKKRNGGGGCVAADP